MKGKFIVFEGPDGAGKTTNTRIALDYLNTTDRPAVLIREPGHTDLGEAIRDIVKNPDIKMDDTTMLLMFAAAMRDVSSFIEETTSKGIHVLCDRFYFSSYVYQGYAGTVAKDDIDLIVARFVHVHPSAFLLYSASYETITNRIGDRYGEKDRFDDDNDFLLRVVEGYEEVYKQYANKTIRINADMPLEQVAAFTKEAIDKVLTCNESLFPCHSN